MLIDSTHFPAWDQKKVLMVPGDTSVTLQFCVDHLLSLCQGAIQDHGAFFWALSGGSTPKAIFSALTQSPYKERIPWHQVHLFWSDERAVPPDHPESNYHMAMAAGLSSMPIPKEQIHRMQAETEIERHAVLYEQTIRKVLKGRPFDLVMLGVGEDGHTASLFPNTQGLHIEDRLIIANFIPEKNSWRMTMTFPCINAASHIALYVLGSSKQQILKQALLSEHSLPSQRVGTKEHKALWIADEPAASLLLAHLKKHRGAGRDE